MVSYQELLGFIWRFMRRQKWVFFVILCLDTLAWPLNTLLWPYILHLVVDVFASYEGDRMAAWTALQGPICGGIALVLGVEIVSRVMGFLMGRAVPKVQADIRMAMFDHIQHHSPRYFNDRFAGHLANQITEMTTQVEVILQQLFWPILPAIATCILGALFLWWINPIFAWMLLGWVLAHLLVSARCTRSCDRYAHWHGEVRSSLLGAIVDSFTNNFSVNLFYRFKYEKQRIQRVQAEEEKTNRRSKQYVERMLCYLSSFYFIGVMLGINGTLIYLWLHDRVSTGQTVQVFTTAAGFGDILWTVSSAMPLLMQAFGTAKQAYSVMKDPEDLNDSPHAKPLRVSSGAITFDLVSFRFGKKRLFENKRVQIQAGEKVGLVGFSGAGKSTFINLILRFFPLHGGRILIDGQDIAQVTLESLRQQIALIPQDPILFHRTLMENIRYGRPGAADAEVRRAAQLAHCEEFIQMLPDGYETKVGERGTKLSGGERQRIAIARAILAETPILILDEATSALDSMTEQYIQESLDQLMQGRTTLAIAHRLSTLASMDRILVFESGKIVEDGSPESLLDKGGLYAQLWRKQVGGFLTDPS